MIRVICHELKDVIRFDSTPSGIQELRLGFEARGDNMGFPQCAGAIDGTHIPIIAPKDSKADYFNRKHFYSMNVQAVADAKRRFNIVLYCEYYKYK